MLKIHPLLFLLFLAVSSVSISLAAEPGAAEPGATAPRVEVPPPVASDTCPVCGMFVSKYPEWVATIQYKDGHAHHFDGAKDMFKYLLDLPKFAPGHQRKDIRAITITEYYGLTKVDARQAIYVIGSDVLGPMGHELLPLASREDAEEFMTDHHGKRILTFDDVDKELLKNLDE